MIPSAALHTYDTASTPKCLPYTRFRVSHISNSHYAYIGLCNVTIKACQSLLSLSIHKLCTIFISSVSNMTENKPQPQPPQSGLKTAKGTRDWVGRDLLLRDHILYA